MKFIDLSLYALCISYKSNMWIDNIFNNDVNNLLLKSNKLNLDTITFLKNNSKFITVYIQEKTVNLSPNISIFIYNSYLLISFSGIRNYKDLLCCLDYNLKYDEIFKCNIHTGILKIFYNIIEIIISIIEKYKKNR